MKVGNLKYLAFNMGRWFESHEWFLYPNYSSHNRRFEICLGEYGKRCDITLFLMLEHDVNTWINHDITVRLDIVSDEDEAEEITLYEKVFHVGDIITEDDMNDMLTVMERVRDCPNYVDDIVRERRKEESRERKEAKKRENTKEKEETKDGKEKKGSIFKDLFNRLKTLWKKRHER